MTKRQKAIKRDRRRRRWRIFWSITRKILICAVFFGFYPAAMHAGGMDWTEAYMITFSFTGFCVALFFLYLQRKRRELEEYIEEAKKAKRREAREAAKRGYPEPESSRSRTSSPSGRKRRS